MNNNEPVLGLTPFRDEQAGITLYSLDEARKNFKVQELGTEGYLVLDTPDSGWVRFAVMEYSSSDLEDKNTLLHCVFHGDGPSDNLREWRHSYWGEDGYIFFVNAELVSLALTALKEYFD